MRERICMQRWSTDRTEAFSDGVFAIAITLLVLDIRVPPSEFNDLWGAIKDQWPSYVGYVTSFAAIGGIWLGHHAIFNRLQAISPAVIRLNLALLGVVAFLPFPTRLVAEGANLHNGAERTAVMFYAATQLLIVILASTLWRAAARERDIIKPEVTDAEIHAVSRAMNPNMATYALATLLAPAAPRAAAIVLLVAAVLSISRARGDRTTDRRSRPQQRGRGDDGQSSATTSSG